VSCRFSVDLSENAIDVRRCKKDNIYGMLQTLDPLKSEEDDQPSATIKYKGNNGSFSR